MNSPRPIPTSLRRGARWAALALALVTGLGLSACGGTEPDPDPAASTPADTAPSGIKEGGTLNLSLAGEPGNLDPTKNETQAASATYPIWCESLYATGPVDEPTTPVLATGLPEIAADGLSATITVRAGGVFTDGTVLDAEAVKFSLDRHKTHPESARAADLTFLDSVEVVDPQSVKLIFSYKVAPGVFFSALAGRGSIIVSPTAVEKLGDEEFNTSPVCVGAFTLTDRIPQDSLTFTRNPDYYDAANVHFDKVVYHIIPDSAVRITNLRAGELDLIDRVAPADLAVLEAESSITIIDGPGLGYHNLAINLFNNGTDAPGEVDRPLARSLKARQALALAIDRDVINQVVYGGQYAPAYGFIVPGSEFATDFNTAASKPDPDKARQLLEESGEELPVNISISLNQQPDYRRVAEVIQQQANAVGFNITLNVGESTAILQQNGTGDFDIYYNTFTGVTDPDTNVTRIVETSARPNTGRMGTAETDDLLLQARAEQDSTKRAALYDQIQKYLNDTVGTIFLVRPSNFVAHSTSLTGVTLIATGGVDIKNAAFTQ
jgi:peptide/nickel transport system substrate-binding protein